MRFKDRTHAGDQLAKKVAIKDSNNAVVLALPRGGIPLGVSISKEHHIPLDVVLAKKITHPIQTEFAIGAVAEGGKPIPNTNAQIKQDWLETGLPQVREEIKRRRNLYDQVLTKQALKNKEVVIVDDGIATGMTMLAAIEAVKAEGPSRLTIAVPIIPKETHAKLAELVDEVFYVEIPKHFLGAVGAYYQQFPQLSDDTVSEILRTHAQ
jgi:predicted phosphoribosyltransferase